jgi:hypothetical protein
MYCPICNPAKPKPHKPEPLLTEFAAEMKRETAA